MTLARRQVLVQELPAVEGLARVDMVCLDKTGTLTEGQIVFEARHLLGDAPPPSGWEDALGYFGADANGNATAAALRPAFAHTPAAPAARVVPFNSVRKYSAVGFDGVASSGAGQSAGGGTASGGGTSAGAGHSAVGGTSAGAGWFFGAPEMLLDPQAPGHRKVLELAAELAAEGLRALLLAHTRVPFVVEQVSAGVLPGTLAPVALLTFREKIRSDAADTLSYFRGQGVALRIISGDSPRTVAAVARAVGFMDVQHGYDARGLPDDLTAMGEVLEREHVLGRVSPEQKKSIVLALQARGYVVAMTGDGVNDALALKCADIGIAMGSGAAATKAVSRLVLLDGQFSRMPSVVAEGRRVIANVERVANLFLTKTAYAVIISLVIGLLLWQYPFLPRQLSIVSSLTIGIPAFFLALLPNKRRYQPGFLRRCLMFSVPAGVIISACILSIYSYSRAFADPALDPAAQVQAGQTATTVTVLLVALWVLSALARPFDRWRALLLAALVIALALILAVPFARAFFALQIPSGRLLAVTMGVVVLGCTAIEFLYRFLKKRGAVSERE